MNSDENKLMVIDSGVHERGLCSYILQAISNLHVSNLTGIKAYINYHASVYNDPKIGLNMWDYYFEQPFGINYEDLKNYKNIDTKIWFDGHIHFHKHKLFTEETRKIANDIITKFIKVKPHIQKIIDDFKTDFIKYENYAAIHYRGTDGHIKDITEWLTPPKSLYFSAIPQMLERYDIVLLCSDEQPFIQECKEKYGDKVIAYNSTRSIDGSPNSGIHLNGNNRNFKYKSGEDVLLESLLMSQSKFLVRTPSNVTRFAIMSNLQLKYVNIDKDYNPYYKENPL
jgi:hypothetical protein